MAHDNRTILPVEFSVIKSYQSKDIRFLDVTIDVLHTGLNYNGSIFNKDVVDKCIYTIKNTPILGYIIVDEDGNTVDYKDHRYKYVENDTGLHFMYDGSAYGVIPESCNPRWVTKTCDDGINRMFLRVDGIMWTKFDRAIEIFNRDFVKGQSMELAENYEGIENSDGTFEFTKFAFDGCCILSTTDPHIAPAMINSVVVANFSSQSVYQDIKEKLTEYNKLVHYQNSDPEFQIEFNKTKEGGRIGLGKKQELLEKYHLSTENLDFSIDEIPEDELEDKLIAFTRKENSNENPENSQATNVSTNFELESQFHETLMEAVSAEKISDPEFPEWTYDRYWFMDYDKDASEVYVIDSKDYKIYGFSYRMNGDQVVLDIDSKKRKKYAIVDFDEGSQLFETYMAKTFAEFKNLFAENRNNLDVVTKNYNKAAGDLAAKSTEFDKLKNQFDSISAKYNKILTDEVFHNFDKDLKGIKEYDDLKENVANYTDISALENTCYMLLGKKAASFSKGTNVREPIKVFTADTESHKNQPDQFYGGIREKYLNK